MAPRRKDETEITSTGKGKLKFLYTDEERTLRFTAENVTDKALAEGLVEGLRSLGNALAGRAVGDGHRTPKPKELEVAPAAATNRNTEQAAATEQQEPEE